MFTPNEIEAMPLKLERGFKQLEFRIMQDVIRKLKANFEEITPATDWQLHRLYELGKSKKDIKEEIKNILKYSNEEINSIYSDVFASGYARDEALYTSVGKEFIPYKENKPLQQLVSAIKTQTKDELKNITGSLGFAVKQPDGKLKFKPIADYYQNTLDNAMLDITSGAFDYNTVLKRTVSEMTNSGLRTVDYASGWSNRIEVATRRAVVTGFNQVVAKVNEDNAKQLETNTFEVSWHSGHRPSHWWGGLWFEHEQLIEVCGLGEPDGLCGCNCYHSYSPVIPGVSVPTYTKEQLADMEAKEQEKKQYGDKQYTKYEALQRQRRLETTMRAQRQRIKLLELGGADEDEIITARGRYMTTSSEYVRFSKEMGLPQQRERVTVDNLYNIGQKNYYKPVEKSTESGIIKENSQKPITIITDNSINRVPKINVSGYTEEQCTELQKQHKELLKYARDNNDSKEVAFVFRKGLKDRSDPIKGTDDKLDFGTSLLGKCEEIIILHNHPRNGSFSTTDIEFFCRNDFVKTITIVKNNGKVEVLTKSTLFNSSVFATEYSRLYRKVVKNGTDYEKDRLVKTLLTKSKSGVMWIEK